MAQVGMTPGAHYGGNPKYVYTPRQVDLLQDKTFNWGDEAACKEDPLFIMFDVDEQFHDEKETKQLNVDQRENVQRVKKQMKKVCEDCTVRVLCLDFALKFPEPFGIWGGFDRKERMAILRRMRSNRDARQRVRN